MASLKVFLFANCLILFFLLMGRFTDGAVLFTGGTVSFYPYVFSVPSVKKDGPVSKNNGSVSKKNKIRQFAYKNEKMGYSGYDSRKNNFY